MNAAYIEYPEIAESQATGLVAAIYDEIRSSVSFVPGLFRSLALCPEYLALAWAQSAPMIQNPHFLSAATQLADDVRSLVRPPTSAAGRDVLARYASGRMLLMASGLEAALDGELPVPEARVGSFQQNSGQGGPSPAGLTALEAQERSPDLFSDIRRALRTPIVNTVWRTAADEGLLEDLWPELAGQIAIALDEAPHVELRARESARTLPWVVGATMSACQQASVADAAPGVKVILSSYRRTLARVLVLVASSTRRA